MHDWKHIRESSRALVEYSPNTREHSSNTRRIFISLSEGIGCLLIGAAFGGLLAWGAFL